MNKQIDAPSSARRRQAVVKWLETFAAAVRDRDFAKGRALCWPNVLSFGTVTERAEGIDQLEAIQWRGIWNSTEGFTFDLNLLHYGGEGNMCWVAVPWSSWAQRNGQAAFERRGRATIILAGSLDQPRALHTHFSLVPGKSSP